jgi:hypothetical protein
VVCGVIASGSTLISIKAARPALRARSNAPLLTRLMEPASESAAFAGVGTLDTSTREMS